MFRLELPKLVGCLARMVRDVGLAEELAQDAFVAALETWPAQGIPDNPGAWLVTTAKRRAINLLEHHRMRERKHDEITRQLADPPDDGNDVLTLMFVACHPILSPEARVALTLRLLGGLTTDEIARAFLTTEPTIAQRIVRAKRALAEAGVGFEIPAPGERVARLASVMEVIYLVFNEGYAANAGDDAMRPELVDDALRLAHMLASLVPDEPEVHGLCALVDLHASRMATRLGPDGAPVLLLDQPRHRWDRPLIRRGLASLARAEQLGGAGLYVLQAKISACHARAMRPEDTDWAQIARLYGALATLRPSPVVEINRAMAVAMSDGPQAGLAIVDAVAVDPALARYHWLPSVRGELLARLGRLDEARAELLRAAELAGNARDREQLRARAAAL